MRLMGLVGLAGAAFVAACGGAPVRLAELGYTAPSEPPALPDTRTVGAAPIVLANAALEANGPFDVRQSEPGYVVAYYSGNPEPYVDCGTLETSAGNVPGAAQQARLSRFRDYEEWQALRQMRLDARIVTRFEPRTSGTRMLTSATYVVTRTADTVDGQGAVIGTRRDTVSFESGGTGRFTKGTVCRPTGSLERAVAEMIAGGRESTQVAEARNLPPAATAVAGGTVEPAAPPVSAASRVTLPVDIAFAPVPANAERVRRSCGEVAVEQGPRGPVAYGYLASAGEREDVLSEVRRRTGGGGLEERLVVLPPGGCDLIATASRLGGPGPSSLNVALQGGPRVLTAGEDVMLDVTMPGASRYFHVAYLDGSGTVTNLGPKFIDQSAIGDRFIYRTGYNVRPSVNGELLLTIASAEPPFLEDRPGREPVASFLQALSRRIDQGLSDASARALVLDTAGS